VDRDPAAGPEQVAPVAAGGQRPDHHPEVGPPVGGHPAEGAGVGAAGTALHLLDDLHGAQLRRPGHRAEWAGRRRLLLAYERLTPDAFTRLWNALIDAGEPGIEILHAYTVKEELRRLLALPPGADPEVISHRLWRFYSQAAASESPEVHRLAETIEAWWPAVLASITTGYTNARSEGYNRLAKHVGRDAFGFRNPTNQRRRIRWACTRQHRRASVRKADLPG
jgi:hypothetical protein